MGVRFLKFFAPKVRKGYNVAANVILTVVFFLIILMSTFIAALSEDIIWVCPLCIMSLNVVFILCKYSVVFFFCNCIAALLNRKQNSVATCA